MVEDTGYLHTHLTVVLGALSSYIGNLCDPVVSHVGQFLFPCWVVRYFFHSIHFSRSPRCLSVVHKPKNRPANEWLAPCQMLANNRPSCAHLPPDWRFQCTNPMRNTQCHIQKTSVPHIPAQKVDYTTSRTRLASMTIRTTTQQNKIIPSCNNWTYFNHFFR